MARITVEDCLREENNRFALVQLASKRTKQLLHGSKSVIEDPRANKAVVTALREIASGRVRFMSAEELAIQEAKEALEAKNREEQIQPVSDELLAAAALFKTNIPEFEDDESDDLDEAEAGIEDLDDSDEDMDDSDDSDDSEEGDESEEGGDKEGDSNVGSNGDSDDDSDDEKGPSGDSEF